MRRRHKLYVIVLLLIAILLLAQKNGWFKPARQTIVKSQPGSYSINHFIDGDTIAVNMNGHTEEVRFIGIDTPETHKPHTPVQCYGPDAAAFTKKTIGNNNVRLESDSQTTDRDRYSRLLRYVYLPDGTNLNELLIQGGYAFYYPYFPFTKAGQFAADEQTAMAAHKGLWAACHPTPTDQGGYVSNPL